MEPEAPTKALKLDSLPWKVDVISNSKYLFWSVLFSVVTAGTFYFLSNKLSQQKQDLQVESLLLGEAKAISQSLRYYSYEMRRSLYLGHLSQDELKQSPFMAFAEIDNSGLEYKLNKINSRVASLNKQTLEAKLSSLPLNTRNLKDKVLFHVLSINPKNSFLTVMTSKNNLLLVGFLKPTDINRFIESRQGNKHSVFVMTDKSMALSHPDRKYIGASLETHGISKMMKNSKLESGVKSEGAQANSSTLLAYDSVLGTNLLVGLEHELEFKSPSPIKLIGSLLIFSLCFLFSIYLFYTRPRRPADNSKYSEILQRLLRGEVISQNDILMSSEGENQKLWKVLEERLFQSQKDAKENVRFDFALDKNIQKKSISDNTLDSQVKDENHLLRLISSNLVAFLDRPLTALTGYLQMAKSESEKIHIFENIDLAQSELKKVKSTVDNLAILSEDNELDLVPTFIGDSLNEIIRQKITQFNQKGIRLNKNIKSKNYANIHMPSFERIIHQTIDFYVINFEDQIERELQIELEDGNSEILLSFTSNNPKLTLEKLTQLINPAHEFISDIDDNLTLSLVNNLMERAGGRVRLHKDLAGSTQLCLHFPLAKAEEVQERLDYVKKHQEYSLKSQNSSQLNRDTDLLRSQHLDNNIEIEVDADHSIPRRNHPEDQTDADEFVRAVRVGIEQGLMMSDKYASELGNFDDLQNISQLKTASSPKSGYGHDEDDDFVMIKPPIASEVPPSFIEVKEPYQSIKRNELKGRTPVQDSKNEFPELPTANVRSVSTKSIFIRKPKVRGNH